jgi:ribose/xylose/arabinose/galactoside ABC-type transport system permease subunit
LRNDISNLFKAWNKANGWKAVLFILDNLAWFLALLVYVSFAVIKPSAMLNIDIIIFIFYVMTTIGLLVLAESIALISGNFDISIDRIVGFVAILVARLIAEYSINPLIGIFLTLFFGLMCGAFNGLLVGILGLNPFVSTLATSIIFSGLLLLVSPTTIWHLPNIYLYIGKNMGIAIATFFVILFFFWFILRYTKLGRNIYSVGGSSSTSLMLGISIKKTLFITYCIVGTICGVAALFYTGFCGSAPINMANNALFPAFAGAVLGGISLRGGRGSIINAFAGGLLIGIIDAGLAMFAVSEPVRLVSTGLLVTAAILIGNFRETLREKISRIL